MFGTGTARRFTQDSPVLPDVWLQYVNEAADEGSSEHYPAVKLLLTPFRESGAGEVRRALHDRLLADRSKKSSKPLPRVIYNQTTVAATLYFEDLVRVVMPMTEWWERVITRPKLDLAKFVEPEQNDGSVDAKKSARGRVAAALSDPEHNSSRSEEGGIFPPDMLWLIRVVGAIALVRGGKSLPPVFGEKNGVAVAKWEDWKPIVDAVANLLSDLPQVTDARSDETGETDPLAPIRERALIYSISLNRQATPTVSRSTLAIKADAARRLFNISCSDLAWGIIDSGIDATHPAFRTRHEKDGVKDVPDENPFELKKGKWINQTRVVATYDFTQIDRLLDPTTDDQPDRIKALLNDPAAADRVRAALDDLNSGLNAGRTIDWKTIAQFLRVPHDASYPDYTKGMHDHGTHVAGILAGDWREKENGNSTSGDLIGVCPDLKLYDLRVLDRNGGGDEFAVMAALQFVRYLNSTNDYVAIHGVNLSLSIPHDIANYACGRTPVCEECERVVSAGTVVVAAAGNQGYRKYTTEEGTAEAYNSISITDPGNADPIITVGATHRYRPHTYGVSYFSSRGPTGDGRIKPDLVAPGEKISAPLPGTLVGVKDGTSMAAPHVSGAAALLMARHNELVGRPARIKDVLKSTATDLGRERYFQGAGMLDVLRALQSV